MRVPLTLLTALCVLACALPAGARAGTYTTVSCGDPDTHQMTGRSGFPPGWAFTEYQPGSGNWSTFASCGSWGGGFGLRTNPIGGRVPYPQWGRIYFSPPADTGVAGVRVARAFRRPYPAPYVVPLLATSPADWCHTYWDGCSVGNLGNGSDPANLAELGGSAWFQLYCDGSQGCPRDGLAAWQVFGARITLSDGHAPSFAGAPTGLPSAAAIGGSPTVEIGGSDRGGGLLRAEVLADGQVLGSASFDSNGHCDTSFHTDLVPCPLTGSRPLGADTTKVADGDHAISARLTDVSGNTTSYALGTKTIDNHAPGAVTPSVVGGDGWRGANAFDVTWENSAADHGSAIAAAHYRLCSTDATPTCTTGKQTGAGITRLTGLSVPASGDYTLTVWLEDAAGNADAAGASAPVHLRYDADPGAPQMQSRSAWLNAQEASVHAVAIAAPAGGASVAGYAVSYDGSDPGTTIDAPADAHGDAVYGPPPGGWPDGRVRVKARAIAATGVASAQVGLATIRVDSTAPELTVAGAGTPSDWRPAPVVLTLGARDAGSGMGAADAGQAVESGGYVAYSLDGQPLRRVGGDEATVAVSGVGAHALTFRAYDAAGNVSADRTVAFLIGRPQTALAEPNFGFWDRSVNPGTTFTAAPSFGNTCPGELALTPARDTYVDEAQPDAAFGSATGLVVRSAPAGNARTLLAFDLPAPGGCTITSAALRVHASATTAGRAIQAFRAGGSWDGDTSWATRPGAVGAPAAAGAAAGGLSFDVTEQVRGIYAHGDNGLMLRDSSDGAAPTAGQAYGSSESVPGERPELIVRYG